MKRHEENSKWVYVARFTVVKRLNARLILYEAFAKNLISYDKPIEDLAKLTRVMWISTDVITEVIRKAGKVRK